jgi:PelA/Pel-15E family pectate lyase
MAEAVEVVMRLLISLFCMTSLVSANEYKAIDLSGFRDGIKHWNDKFGRDRDDERYDPNQIVEIADNILAFQVKDGGWPKNLDPQLKVPESEIRRLYGRSLDRSTFDNRATYTHVDYLASVYTATGMDRFRAAAERGLDYIFAEQRRTGGWRGADVDAVTYNDDVMLGILIFLRDIARSESHFSWLDKATRVKVITALERAVGVTLKCQIVVDGVRTGWCQQHSHETFEPVKARSYELPSICPAETSGILQFLMDLSSPTPKVAAAIEAGVAWLEKSKIEGIRVKDFQIDPVRFENHTTTRDRIIVEEVGAPPHWARFYEVETNRPFFCNRDGIKVYSLAEVKLERRTGYGWYTGSPNRILDVNYPAWKSRFPAGVK